MSTPLIRIVAPLALAAAAVAQVPDGYYVFGSFQGAAGLNGIYFAHPRDSAAAPIPVTGLPPALGYDPAGRRGAACVNWRSSDQMLFAGERSPAGTSVDLHMLRLNGAAVVFDQLFSVGTSANVGEIPQAGLLPDGRIVLAATDLMAGGPLAQFQTLQYNWEGVGIVDPISGSVTPVPISNLSAFPGVINGLAVTPDGATIYLGNYISATAGDLWSVPITGGVATLVASLPAGSSNVAIDGDGTVLVTTLNGPPNLFRYDPSAQTTTPVATTTGPLNAIAVESVTGNYVLATANAGVPSRSLVWMTPGGQENVLLSPNLATISAVDVNPNPEAYGVATVGTASYDWQLAPNPGGLPQSGNAGFSLTLTASDPSLVSLSAFVLSLARSVPPGNIAGLGVEVDLGFASTFVGSFQGSGTTALPIPAGATLVGMPVFAQTFLWEVAPATVAASRGVEFTIL